MYGSPSELTTPGLWLGGIVRTGGESMLCFAAYVLFGDHSVFTPNPAMYMYG